MQENRKESTNREQKRMSQIAFILEHWDELPENLQGRFEGIISTTQDFLKGQVNTKAV